MAVVLFKPAAPQNRDPGAQGDGAERAADRRGPLRPAHLASSRKRIRGELLAYSVRSVDGLVLFAVVLGALAASGAARLTLAPGGLFAAAPLLAAALLSLTGLQAAQAYDFRRREAAPAHLARVAAGQGAGALILALTLLTGAAPQALVNALALQAVASLASLLAVHAGWLGLVHRWRRLGRLTPNVVLVGANEHARDLIRAALRTGEIAILGIFEDRHARAPTDIEGVPVLGDTAALIDHRIMPYVDQIVIAIDAEARHRVANLMERLSVLPNDVTLMVDLGGPDTAAETFARLVDTPLGRIHASPRTIDRVIAKRVQDVVLAALGLVVALPVMALIALAVKLDSPGPIFFRQRRQGFNNEEIVVWKFRSLRHEARDDDARQQVVAGDTRVTRVGRFIRRTSLDELPQLINVLSGEMSLVGPRPHAPDMRTGQIQSARIVDHYAHRHRMKPGITGWAAIHGSRGPLDRPELVRRRVELDIAYIERQSFWLDLYILIATLPCLLGDRLNRR